MTDHFRFRTAVCAAAAMLALRVDAQAPVRAEIRVREDHGSATSREIPLAYVVLPAIGPATSPPLVVIQGGPGVPGTALLERFRVDTVLRRSRPIVLFDQRGTGGSHRLSCDVAGGLPPVRDRLFPSEFLSRCRDSLALKANLPSYNTTSSASDIEALRIALGAPIIDLYGISYGTRLGQEYVRKFPVRVRRVAFDGVIPPQTLVAAAAATHIDAAIERVVAQCGQRATCNREHPQLRFTWDSLRSASPGDTGAQWRIAYALRGVLYTQPELIPALVDAIGRHDLRQIDSVYATRAAWVSNATGTALYLGANCAEDILHIDPITARRDGRGTVIRDMFFTQHLDACRIWGTTRGPRLGPLPVQRRITALLLSGEFDPVTPPVYAAMAMRSFKGGRHVVFAGAGHANPSRCKSGILAEFFNGAAPVRVDARCAEEGVDADR